MKQLLKQNAVFITLSLMLFVALGLAILCIPKGELHLLLCNHHTPARDIFFRYYTQIAEYLPYIVCCLLLLFGRTGDGAMATACVAGAELTTQIVKHIVNAPRPVTWFATHMPDVQLPLVEGVKIHHWFSFPSGHTTSFFALFFVLSIIVTQNLTGTGNAGLTAKRYDSASGMTGVAGLLQASFFVLAAIGGYSRIYLSQHFAADVMGGIGVGLTISCIAYAVFARQRDKKWYNYRLFTKK
ncbi:MAG: phosphatase PAP2 family protein [Paludibacteraceae bacterium]|nr:phosphatase PAP2 family protein [Paludibacteraceae bacterium]